MDESSKQNVEYLLMQNNPPLRQRRQRTNFNDDAISSLEEAFAKNPYPDIVERETMARALKCTEDRIQVWFQNKRARFRKRLNKENSEKDVPKKQSTKPEAKKTSTVKESQPISPVPYETPMTRPGMVSCQHSMNDSSCHSLNDSGYTSAFDYTYNRSYMGGIQFNSSPMFAPLPKINHANAFYTTSSPSTTASYGMYPTLFDQSSLLHPVNYNSYPVNSPLLVKNGTESIGLTTKRVAKSVFKPYE